MPRDRYPVRLFQVSHNVNMLHQVPGARLWLLRCAAARGGAVTLGLQSNSRHVPSPGSKTLRRNALR
jgi:hypothetical protein